MWEGRGKEEECVSSGRSEASRHLRQCREWKAGERQPRAAGKAIDREESGAAGGRRSQKAGSEGHGDDKWEGEPKHY